MNTIRTMWIRLVFALGALALMVIGSSGLATAADEIVWSVHVGITGPAACSGAKQAEGIQDYVAWKNAHGGIRGRMIKLLMTDTTFQPAEAVAGFKRVLSNYKPVYVSGDGTAMTKALNAENNSTYDILMTSGSFGTEFDDTKNYPLHFMAGPSYGDQIEIALKYVRSQYTGTRTPKVAMVHSNIAFGRDPIERLQEVAKRLKIDVALIQQTKFVETDVSAFALAIRQARPDFVVFHGYAFSVWPEIMRQVREYGLDTKFLGTIWAMDRIKVMEIGPAADGYMGVQPYPYSTAGRSELILKEIDKILRDKDPKYDGHAQIGYFHSWANALLATKAIEMAIDKGQPLTGTNLANNLRTVKDWDTGGVFGTKVSVTGQKIGVGRIYRWNAKKDWTPEPVSDWITVD